MNDVSISKKYVKALLAKFDTPFLVDINSELKKISKVFLISKFVDIINSPTKTSLDKSQFIISLMNSKITYLHNFIKILSDNNRLMLIPTISKLLDQEMCIIKNEYSATIYSKDLINEDKIKRLEDSLSKRFKSTIHLQQIQNDYNGVKVDLDSLGFEISFSADELRNKISEYILKAI